MTRLAGHSAPYLERTQRREEGQVTDTFFIANQKLDNRRFSPLENEIEQLEKRISIAQQSMARLKKLGPDDPHLNGTILSWWDSEGIQHSALRRNGRWALSDTPMSVDWEDLAVTRLAHASGGHVLEIRHLEDGSFSLHHTLLDPVDTTPIPEEN